MPDRKNICLIDAPQSLINGFKSLGCTVLDLRATPEPFFSLPEALDGQSFVPDLVLQVESLGARSLVSGLNQVDCPVMLWCVDPHLNAHWHSAWARLFDLTCSTQKRCIGALRERGAEDVRWLPWFGSEQPQTPMADRTTDIAFVGRITAQRPARQWMVEFLEAKAQGHSLAVQQDLNFRQMLELYRSAKIIPNESIFGEINFRLFEAASCGCLVLDQDLGEEQAELFEPGREIDTCAHVAELDHKLARYLGNDRLVQAMGRAAFERVRAEHLPVHRVQRILDYAADATSRRARGAQGAKWTALTVCAMWEAGQLRISAADVLARLETVAQDSDVAAAMLRIQLLSGGGKVVTDNLSTILGRQLYADCSDLNLTGSMAALRLGHFDGAKAFWYRHCLAMNSRKMQPPCDATELLTLWAKDLSRRGRILRAGFSFDPKIHLPATAAECLMTILADEPQHLPTLRLLDTMLRPISGLEQARVGFLSILTLHERDDWRLAFEIGLADLKSYRLDSGLEELHLAREITRKNDQEALFDKVLKARDPSGLLAARLG